VLSSVANREQYRKREESETEEVSWMATALQTTDIEAAKAPERCSMHLNMHLHLNNSKGTGSAPACAVRTWVGGKRQIGS
jgi:hypothetical protein